MGATLISKPSFRARGEAAPEEVGFAPFGVFPSAERIDGAGHGPNLHVLSRLSDGSCIQLWRSRASLELLRTVSGLFLGGPTPRRGVRRRRAGRVGAPRTAAPRSQEDMLLQPRGRTWRSPRSRQRIFLGLQYYPPLCARPVVFIFFLLARFFFDFLLISLSDCTSTVIYCTLRSHPCIP